MLDDLIVVEAVIEDSRSAPNRRAPIAENVQRETKPWRKLNRRRLHQVFVDYLHALKRGASGGDLAYNGSG